MSSINPLRQSLFVDQQSPGNKPLFVGQESKPTKSPVVIEADFVRIGNNQVVEQADELFTRANAYAKLDNELSPQAQQGLQAYTSLEVASKRDALSKLMGVDLYA